MYTYLFISSFINKILNHYYTRTMISETKKLGMIRDRKHGTFIIHHLRRSHHFRIIIIYCSRINISNK